MDEIARGTRYLFILALALILFAYWAGANQLAKTALSGINTIGLTYTGRDSQGRFANYPSGGPK